jgi:NADH-quinone oxidoreductase subunit G
MAARAAFPPGDAREDWAIIRALSEHVGHKLGYDSLAQLRQALFAAYPHLMRVDRIEPTDSGDVRRMAQVDGAPDKAPFTAAIEDFYLSNPIARASAVMAECSAIAEGRRNEAAE